MFAQTKVLYLARENELLGIFKIENPTAQEDGFTSNNFL